MPSDRFSDVVRPPGLQYEGDVGWHVLLADRAGGEHDPQIGPQMLRGLGQFDSTHAGHTHIREQDLDLGMSLEKLEGLVAVVGVEHCAAEAFDDADRRGADLRHVVDHENGNVERQRCTSACFKLLNATAWL